MKPLHWIAVIGALYFAVTGVNEFLPSGTVASLDNLPDWGGVLTSGSGATGANTIAGAADLATAAGIYFLVLHKHVMA